MELPACFPFGKHISLQNPSASARSRFFDPDPADRAFPIQKNNGNRLLLIVSGGMIGIQNDLKGWSAYDVIRGAADGFPCRRDLFGTFQTPSGISQVNEQACCEKGDAIMKLLFKQRFFSWFDSYDIFDEYGQTVYIVKGQLSWGHRLQIYDASGHPLGRVQERVLTWLPKFELYVGEQLAGEIRKEFTLFRPRFQLDCCGWQIDGNFWEWDYTVSDGQRVVMYLSKELWNWTDTYVMEIDRPEDALYCLMIVLAIDAAKCSHN